MKHVDISSPANLQLTHNATRDAAWAFEARRCLGNLKSDLNYCLNHATRDSSGKKKRHRWHFRAPASMDLCIAERARLFQAWMKDGTVQQQLL